MNKLDTLDRGILELRNLLSEGWRNIASGELTAFERGEIRNRMVRAAADLRRCLQARENEIAAFASFPGTQIAVLNRSGCASSIRSTT